MEELSIARLDIPMLDPIIWYELYYNPYEEQEIIHDENFITKVEFS